MENNRAQKIDEVRDRPAQPFPRSANDNMPVEARAVNDNQVAPQRVIEEPNVVDFEQRREQRGIKNVQKKYAKAGRTATKTAGTTLQVAGTATQMGGKTVKATGRGARAAGTALSATGAGAVIGVPLAAAGIAAQGVGTGVDAAGKATRKAGGAIKKAGKVRIPLIGSCARAKKATWWAIFGCIPFYVLQISAWVTAFAGAYIEDPDITWNPISWAAAIGSHFVDGYSIFATGWVLMGLFALIQMAIVFAMCMRFGVSPFGQKGIVGLGLAFALSWLPVGIIPWVGLWIFGIRQDACQ